MINIEQHVWGSTPEGEAIILYTIKNRFGSEVHLTNLGAAVVAVKFADRNGKIEDVALGYKEPMSYMGDGAACGKSVGRVANRIARGRMTVEGKEYRLEINNGPNHLHGGSKNFANRIWECRVEQNRVVFSLLSEDGDQGYPGDLFVEAIYDFTDDNTLEITYLAKSSATTVVNLTNHLYWNLAGENSGETIHDHELKMECHYALEADSTQIPTGKLLDVKGTAMDFLEFRRLGDGISSEFNRIKDFGGYDHYWVMDNWEKNILKPIATLRHRASGRKIELFTSQPGIMLYTGNWLSGGCPKTKSGGYYEDFGGVALECQNYPDAVNKPEFPTPILKPGELYCQKIMFRLGVME